MLMEEFTARTGYKPTFEEYRVIEKDYSCFDGNKDAFCQKWLIRHEAREIVFNAVQKCLNRLTKREGNTPRVEAVAEYVNLFAEILY